MALLESIGESLGSSKFLMDPSGSFGSSLMDPIGNDEMMRSLPGTAMGGVALAFIGMILEFITLSGFHPAVS